MNKVQFGYNYGKPSLAIIPATQERAEREDWQAVDFAVIGGNQGAELYAEYKAAYHMMKQAREAYEAHMRLALGIAATQSAKSTTPKRSLADYLAARGVSGLAI